VNSKILTNGFHKFEENLSRGKSMHIERLKDISTTLFHMPTKAMIETNPSLGHTTRMSQQQTEQLHLESPRQKFISQIHHYCDGWSRIPLTLRKHSKDPANEPPIARSVRNLKLNMACHNPHSFFF
jgi:hypothetical protein